jgi:hypothetical protein
MGNMKKKYTSDESLGFAIIGPKIITRDKRVI